MVFAAVTGVVEFIDTMLFSMLLMIFDCYRLSFFLIPAILLSHKKRLYATLFMGLVFGAQIFFAMGGAYLRDLSGVFEVIMVLTILLLVPVFMINTLLAIAYITMFITSFIDCDNIVLTYCINIIVPFIVVYEAMKLEYSHTILFSQ